MSTLVWAVLTVAAVVWPAAIAGPLDGAPLDHPLEAIVLGVLMPWLFVAVPRLLKRRDVRTLIVALLAWKATSGILLARDGWCLRFTSPVPVFVDDVRVPHSWDVRADWRSDVPQCSAIMTMNYPELERFPVWFYNLPPANFRDPVRPGDRPPATALQMDLAGYLHTRQQGTFKAFAGEDLTLSATVDGLELSHDQLRRGIALSSGDHDVHVRGDLRRSHWSLDFRFNDVPMWQSAMATTTRASSIDVWFRPVGRYVPPAVVLILFAIGIRIIAGEAGTWLLLGVVSSILLAAAASVGRDGLTRALPLALAIPAALAAWRRERSYLAHALVVGLPFLSIFMTLGWPRAGVFSWFSSGDDWWTFQRLAYRIYMQGYWLEAGEKAFYFQPLYRWIAGGLHMVFGDSSVGELFWDAAAAWTGASFSFAFVKASANARWAWAASVLTLMIFVLGPTWYLIGRGLAEFSSTGFVYGGALCALRARSGSRWLLAATGLLAALAFYTRSNNGPLAIALCLSSLPMTVPATAWRAPQELWRRLSNPVTAAVLCAMAIALHLYSLRTWYYTGRYDLFYGSSMRGHNLWTSAEPIFRSVTSSVLMMLSMNDPPQFDIRALPLFAGAAASVLACLGVSRLAQLPLSAAGLCLAALSSALVVRGEAYPCRFSVHMVPICATVTICALFCLLNRARPIERVAGGDA